MSGHNEADYRARSGVRSSRLSATPHRKQSEFRGMSAENARYRLEDANDLFSEGDRALSHSRPEKAKSVFESALVIYRRVGSALGEANCVRRLADIAVRQSRYAAATEGYDLASRLYYDLKNTQGEANCRKGLGDLALLSGNHADAKDKYQQALTVF